MGAEKKAFSFAEVSLHNVAKDCWVIVNAKAYDVTNFLEEHPGGEEILLAVAGQDASEDFEDAGHGSAARLMLDEFYVGEVDPSTMPETTITKASTKEPWNEEKSSGFNTKVLRFLLVPLAVSVVAVGIHFYN